MVSRRAARRTRGGVDRGPPHPRPLKREHKRSEVRERAQCDQHVGQLGVGDARELPLGERQDVDAVVTTSSGRSKTCSASHAASTSSVRVAPRTSRSGLPGRSVPENTSSHSPFQAGGAGWPEGSTASVDINTDGSG